MRQGMTGQTAEALHGEGIALYRSKRFDEALACYNEAIARKPDFASAFNSRGFLLQDMGQTEAALRDFAQAVALAPGMAMARLNLGMAQLKMGQFEAGWENYEARWTGSAEAQADNRPACPLPMWQGDPDTRHKRLLVITEQGFGDTFQMARYLPLLAQRFAKVSFACSAPTQRVIEWSFGDQVNTLTRMPSHAEAWQQWDVHCPMMSLPRAFGTRLDSIPADVPYLRVPPSVGTYWGERVAQAAPHRLRVGVAWAGRKAHMADARRSLRFEQLAPLLADERVSWFSLQKWLPGDTSLAVPASVDWIDWTEEGSADFADAAALIDQLDLVITIDSAMAHLAGALGKPTWLLDRFDNEWRWLTGRQNSPWYPSLRIFRQSSLGDWDGVLTRVRDALARLAAPRPIAPRHAAGSQRPGSNARQPMAAATTQTNLSIEQALQLAGQHQSAGRLPQAEGLLRQILQVQASHAPARHLLGVVLYQAGHAQAAIDLISQAVAQEPNVALFHSNLAEMCRQQRLLERAIHHGERAVALDPSMASAHSNLGIAYYDAEQYAQARTCHEQALALNPRMLQSLNNLGSIARALKDSEAAIARYQQALAVQPDYLEALSNLGAVLVEGDGFEAAAEPLEHALRLHPHYPEALCNLGLLRLKQERTDEAIHLLEQCLRHRPGYPEAIVGLALGLHEKDDLASAMRLLREVVTAQPHRADAWCHLGTVCQELGDIAEAERAYATALSIDPQSADALTGQGNLRLEQGKMDEAEALLRLAIATDDEHLPARFHLVQVKKVRPDDDNLLSLERRLADIDTLGTDKRISLHYALGKAYDDLREWDKAFPHFIEGARLKRAKFAAYDPASESARIDHIIDTVDSQFLRRLDGHGHKSDLPVFVLGMPRSGTTLTEQIIASHPHVHGAGELGDLMAIVQRQTVSARALPYPNNLDQLTPEVLAQWGQDYVDGLRQRAPGAQRITDKMPSNYLAMGLIPLMLPHARIIHVKRNPMDTCVSCFTRLFNRHQEATYDLLELGRHYANYARLMDHWRAVLPPGSFMEVQYEEIVADMPQQARRLLDFVGLPWDDACLAFHRTERIVRTASVTQVRQPIYTSSVERWRNYERYLAPLRQGLGGLAPQ